MMLLRISQLSVLVLIFSNCYCQINNDSLIAFYNFNGNGNDISGNNYHCILNGPASYTTDRYGNNGSAFTFNGIDNHFLINNTDTRFKPTGFPVTISAWINVPSGNSHLMYIFKNDFAPEIYSGIRVTVLPNGRIECGIEDGGPIGEQSRRSKSGTTDIKDDKWHLVSCIIRGPLNMDIYIDCKNDGGKLFRIGRNHFLC
jgi:hypothetical protein